MFSFEEILSVTKEIETIFVSLHQQGRCFSPEGTDRETDDMWRAKKKPAVILMRGAITGRLSKACRTLYSRMESMLGTEERDLPEQEMEKDEIRFREKPGDNCLDRKGGKMLLKNLRQAAFFVLTIGLSVYAVAADLSRYDGLWVVDIKPSAEAWEKAGQPMDETAYAVFSAHGMRVDFTNSTIIEGIVIGYEHPEESFTVTEKETDVYELHIDGRRKRTFLWRIVDDSHIIVSVQDGESPPLYFLREYLQQYSGLWKVTNVDAVLAKEEAIMKKERRPMSAEGKKRAKRILSTMRMRIDFSEKTLSWEDEKGDRVYGGPAGEFVVDNRQENGATLVFDGNRPAAEFRIFGPEKISVTDRGIPIEMERVSGK